MNDLPLLPQPWNFEFWTKHMSEEEIDMFNEALKAAFDCGTTDPSLCKVCLRPPDIDATYWLTCGHMPFCADCTQEIAITKKCPVDRCPKKGKIKVVKRL